jgi:hypothetical protein
VQPLQSVNYLDSRAHDHERHGPFTRLAGILVGMIWVGTSRSGLVCSRCEACVHVLATSGMPVSIGHLWLQVRLL